MSAQPAHPADPRIHPIPRTIEAVADALSGAQRMAFYAEIGQTDEEELRDQLHLWWMEAMFEQRPGREQRLADAHTGRNLRPLPPLAGENA